MNRKIVILVLALAVLWSPACLQQQTGHTLYLSPDAAVTWTTTERDIRSDAQDPSERMREEHEFLSRLTAGGHPMLTALRSLGPASSRARLLRRDRPYIVMTEAHFERADRLMQRLLDELRISGTATLTRHGDATTLSVAFEVPQEEPEFPDESAITPLIVFDEPYRLVLTTGRFVTSEGFTIESGETTAALDEEWMKARCEPGATVRLSVTWSY